MQFGAQFFPAIDPAEMSGARYFRESLAIADEGEKLGLTHARIVEHYFHPYGGYSPNPMLFLSALSQRTTTMRMLTGAVLPVFNHPLKLAGDPRLQEWAPEYGRIETALCLEAVLDASPPFTLTAIIPADGQLGTALTLARAMHLDAWSDGSN